MDDAPHLVTDALRKLRADGYAVSADRLQRFRAFGIRSKRIGRRYYLSARTIRDLRFVLDVESHYKLARDRDGLALELAYRNYPVVPWRRVHAAARKRAPRLLSEFNRALHREAKVRGKGFSDAAIRRLSLRLARRYIPDKKLEEDISNGLARELLEFVLEMLLQAAYHRRRFEEAQIRRMFMTVGAPENDARDQAAVAAAFFNEGLFPLIQMNEGNAISQAVSRPAAAARVKAAVQVMREAQWLLPQVQAAIHSRAAFPTPEGYPEFHRGSRSFARVDFAVHCILYAVMFDLTKNAAASTNIARYRDGLAPEIDQALRSISNVIDLTPKVIRKPYE